jgi:shikimate kinase
VLIGFMGSGKSTVGPLLAEAMNLDFVDLDQRIVELGGVSIPDLFEQLGEIGFRRVEKQALEDVLVGSACVLACGGGTPCQPGLFDRLAEWGDVVFLDVSFSELESRKMLGRPLWDKNAEDLYRSRRPVYEKASIHVDADQAPERIAEAAMICLGFRA